MSNVTKNSDGNCRAHSVCDHIEKSGGVVLLNNEAFNELAHILWGIWEDGYNEGKEFESIVR